jgi:hypothetical protein
MFLRHYVRNCLLADAAFPTTKLESSRRTSTCSFLQPPANLPLVDPNVLVSALFSNTPSVLFPDGDSYEVHTTRHNVQAEYSDEDIVNRENSEKLNLRPTEI